MYSEIPKEKIIQYLIDNKQVLQDVIKDLQVNKDDLLKEHDHSLHEDIEIEFYKVARLICAERIGTDIAESPEEILYILECIGLDSFKEYLK